MPAITLSRAAIILQGVSVARLARPDRPELTPEAAVALTPLLKPHGFDVTRPIHVDELPDLQGFRMTQ
jgi:hypothetical protein